VAIARALATSPRLLLMDEPLAALDAARKAEMLPYLDRLHARAGHLPIVYVTHAIDEVARLADHLVLMDAGRVLAAGPLADCWRGWTCRWPLATTPAWCWTPRSAQRDAQWQLARLDVDGEACRLWTATPAWKWAAACACACWRATSA
jgi:molybdate transport system ATP-binding protein